jgi:hypothetical protein
MAKFRNGNVVLTSSQTLKIGDVTLSRSTDGNFESNVSIVAPDSTNANTLATVGYVDSVAGGGGGGLFTEDANGNIFGGTGAAENLSVSSTDNFFAGVNAGNAVSTAFWNVVIGEDAMLNNVSGSGNVTIGFQAGFGSSSQSYAANTFVGYWAGRAATNGQGNASFGYQALDRITTGDNNTAIGRGAGESGVSISGDENVFVGYRSGQSISSGTNNVCVGSYSGYGSIGSGTGNVFIGYEAGRNIGVNSSNQLRIANNQTEALIEGDFSARTVTINGTLTVEQLITDATTVIIGTTELSEKSGGGLLVNGQEIGGGGVTDHGALTGLADDDHTQYFKTDGTRVMTGPIQFQNGGSADEVSTDSASDSTSVLLTSSAVQEAISSNLVFTEDGSNNIVGGTGATGDFLTTGIRNFIAGVNAGSAISEGSNNVFVGFNAGEDTSTGNNNIGIGANALTQLTTGSDNIGIGGLTGWQSSERCIFIGNGAGSVYDGNESVIIGYEAGTELLDGEDNVLIGSGAGRSDSGDYDDCVIIGSGAGSDLASGNGNTVIGRSAMVYNSANTGNTVIGFEAGRGSVGTDYDYSVIIGHSAYRLGATSSSTQHNIVIGRSAAENSVSGDGNIFMGYNAGKCDNDATHNDVVYIGDSAGGTNLLNGGVENDTNSIYIGKLAGVASGASIITEAQNNVLIGADCRFGAIDTTSINRIGIGYQAIVDADNKAVIGNSSVTTIGGFATWTDYSDRSIKTNIQDSDIGIEFIRRLRTRRFEKKDQLGKMHDGLIAQEVREVMDELGIDFSGWVEPGSNGLQMLQYSTFVMPLINAATKQQEEIETLRSEVDELKRQISEIIGQLKK